MNSSFIRRFFRFLLLSLAVLSLMPQPMCQEALSAVNAPLRVGVAGLTHGHVGWILGRPDRGDIQLVGIAESNTDLSERLAERYNLGKSLFYTDLEKMLDAVRPEAVLAFGSIYEHLEVVRACAPRGIHVMVEKPLAVSMEHAREMDSLARAHDIQLLTNYETTWYASHHEAYRLIQEEGKIGELHKLVVHDGHPGPKKIGVSQEFMEWLGDPVLNGGGAVVDFGCYGANLTTWFMQGRRPTTVRAVTQNFQPAVYPKVDDEATIILTYPQAQSIIQASWNWPFSRKDMHLYGENGYVYCDNRTQIRTRYLGEKEQMTQLEERKAPYDDPFAYLAGVIRGRIQPPPYALSSLENNLIVVEILDAARESARTGKEIKVDYDDFAVIKERVIAELMKDKIDDDRVESILNKIHEDGSFQGINYDDLSRTAGFPHRRHTSDLVDLALAYQDKSSGYYRDQKVKAAIVSGLRYWVDHDFFGDNWHNNQISTPTNLVNLMLLVGEELPKDLVDRAQPIIGRANMNASGARPSGDRIVIAGILAKNLLFTGNRKAFDEVIRIIEGELKFSTGERGMQHDYSFHHRTDRVNNTTSYGYGKYANAFGEWSYYVAGTQYAFSLEKINQLVDYYLDGIYKQMVYGIYTDISVKNRSISQQADFEPHGTLEIERLLFSTDYRKDELEQIIRLRKGEAKPSASFAKFFWQTEHFVFQRPNFYTTVRMFSTRNRNMEEPYNGPGITTHHRADGTNYLMLRGDEYHNIWPVYDWQKISGTTILQKPALHGPDQIQMDGLTDFVGAVTDGLYGAVAFDFKSPHDGTEAKKSWFFFDEEYVCLGTDIKASANLPVATTINQVLMRSDVTIKQDGEIKKLPRGSRELNNVKWVYQDKIGYIFPNPSTINLSNQVEQGRWSDITDQKNISEEVVREDVFTLWFDHGSRPNHASYQYIVAPAISEEELKESGDDNRGIEILSNTSDLQAVKSTKQGICQLAFYRGGEVEIAKGAKVSMTSQGMAMLKMQGNRIETLTLADPSRKLSSIMITVPGIYKTHGEHFRTLPDEQKNNTLVIVDLPQGVYLGKSVTIQL